MITIPFDQLISTIMEKKDISRVELDSRIKQKMDQLSGLISKEGAAHIVANELGIKLFDATGGKLKIGKILGGMRDVETVGQVLRKFDIREFQGKLGPGKVGSMIIGDETGQIRVVLWNDMTSLMDKFSEGDVVKLRGAQAKQNRERKELHLNAKSRIQINPPGEKVVGSAAALKRVQIAELTPEHGQVELKATIVQVFDLRFYEVCPQCKRRLQQKGAGWECPTHGEVSPTYSYALTFFSDDGSGNIRSVAFGATVEALTGKSKEELLEIKDDASKFDSIRTALLGTQMLLSGRANRNEMFDRIEFIARDVKLLDVDAEIAQLKQRVGTETAAPVQPQAPSILKKPETVSPAKTAEQTEKPATQNEKNPSSGVETAGLVNPSSPKVQPKNPESSEGELDDFDIDEELI